MDAPRVAFVVYGELDERSGGFLYDRILATHLDEHGWDVDVVSIPERPYFRSAATNLAPGLVGRLRACDVVIEDAYCHPSVVGVNRRLPDTPVVALVHYVRSMDPSAGWRARAVRAIERDYVRTVDGCVFNSTATKESVIELVGRADLVVPNVVVPPGGDRLGSGEPLAGERLHADPFRVVSVGTVTPRKGVTTLIEGLAGVDDDWRLHVVGDTTVDPEYVASTRELARDRGVDDAVRFLGRVSDDRLRAELQAGHVLALPSRYEPFGTVYLEGMAFGLPAIATTNGGADDVVTPENGVLVPPDSPEAVAEAIAPLSRDRERLGRMSGAAAETYHAQPTWEERCTRIRHHLEKFAEGHRPQ